MNINLYHFKLYRQIYRPLGELKHWRVAQKSVTEARKHRFLRAGRWFLGSIMAIMTLYLVGCDEVAFGSNMQALPHGEKIIAGYTLNTWVNAIGWAECGPKMDNCTYYYGIRSVHYESKDEAKKICAKTVLHNWQRFKNGYFKRYTPFIVALQSRYCPNTQRYSHQGEIWIRNVSWYLHHPKRG